MNLSHARIIKLIASITVSVLIMVAIFSMSGQNGGDSRSLSQEIASMLAALFIEGFWELELVIQEEIIAGIDLPIRKIAHGTEYACLGISLLASFWQIRAAIHEKREDSASIKQRMIFSSVCAFILSVIYAASDEVHQLFIDGRSGMFTDVLVDSLGAAIGIVIVALIANAALTSKAKRLKGSRLFQ